LQVFYTVDNPTKTWKGGAGYISKDMVVKGLPAPSDDTLVLVSFSFRVKTMYHKHNSSNKFEQFEPPRKLNVFFFLEEY